MNKRRHSTKAPQNARRVKRQAKRNPSVSRRPRPKPWGRHETQGLSLTEVFAREADLHAAVIGEGIVAALKWKRERPSALIVCSLSVEWIENYHGEAGSFQCGICQEKFLRPIGGAVTHRLHLKDDWRPFRWDACFCCVDAGLAVAVETLAQRVTGKVNELLIETAPHIEASFNSLVGRMEVLRDSLKNADWWPSGEPLEILRRNVYRERLKRLQENFAEWKDKTKARCRCGYPLFYREKFDDYWDAKLQSKTFSLSIEQCPKCGRQFPRRPVKH